MGPPGELSDWPPRGRRAGSPLAISLRGGATSSPALQQRVPSQRSPRSPSLEKGQAESGVRPRAGCRGAGSYQRGQLVACPCASAPAQFNGHCPPAPLFRRRPLPAGPGWGRRAETLRAEAQTTRPPQPGVRGDGHPSGALWGWGSEPEEGVKLGSAQPSPLGVSRLQSGRVSSVFPPGEAMVEIL